MKSVTTQSALCGREFSEVNSYMIFKRIVAVILIAALMAGGTGCMGEKQQSASQKQDIWDLGISYMEERYGETFSYAAPAGNSFGSDTRKFLVTCDSLPGEKICVQVDNVDSENRVFSDNYLVHKYKEKTVTYFQTAFQKQFKEFAIYYNISQICQNPKIAVDSSFEQILQDDSIRLDIIVKLKRSEFQSKEQFQTIFQEIEKCCGYVQVIAIVVEDTEFDTLSESETMYYIRNDKYYFGVRAFLGKEHSIKWLLEE